MVLTFRVALWLRYCHGPLWPATWDLLPLTDREHALCEGRCVAEGAEHEAGGSEALSTVVLAQGSTIYTKSSAAARALAMLDRPVCYVAGLIYIIPAPLRDVGYRIVAANRYRIFGRSETCRAPSPSFEQRFLEYEGTSTPKFLA